MNHLFPLPVRALRPLQHLNIQSSCGISQLITDSREVIHHRLEFAIIDFDFAMIIPRREDGKDLLPSSLAWMQEYSALDVAQGELVYDPFKYDVGVLGVMFCEMLQVSHSDVSYAVTRLMSQFLRSSTTYVTYLRDTHQSSHILLPY